MNAKMVRSMAAVQFGGKVLFGQAAIDVNDPTVAGMNRQNQMFRHARTHPLLARAQHTRLSPNLSGEVILPETLNSVLLLLLLLQIKHMFADFYLQTPRMLAARDVYLHFGRAQHAGLHALGSAAALLVVGATLPLLIMIIAAEWVAHYHIDWGKGWYSTLKQHAPTEPAFWRAIGCDQALHQLTYVAMIWAWATFAVI